MLPVLTTPAVNLPPIPLVSLNSVNDTGGKNENNIRLLILYSELEELELQTSPQIIEKIRYDPNGTLRGLGKLIHEKKLKSKISWQCPFKAAK